MKASKQDEAIWKKKASEKKIESKQARQRTMEANKQDKEKWKQASKTMQNGRIQARKKTE